MPFKPLTLRPMGFYFVSHYKHLRNVCWKTYNRHIIFVCSIQYFIHYTLNNYYIALYKIHMFNPYNISFCLRNEFHIQIYVGFWQHRFAELKFISCNQKVKSFQGYLTQIKKNTFVNIFNVTIWLTKIKVNVSDCSLSSIQMCVLFR